MKTKTIRKPKAWDKAYALGTIADGAFTAGPFESLKEAMGHRGDAGEVIWRLSNDDQPATVVREWRDEEWVKIESKKYSGEKENEQAPPVSNDVELAFFESRLAIDKNALDDALVEQPDLMGKVSSRSALALSLRDETKDRIKQVEGELYAEIKDQIEKTDNKRPTDKGIEARINSHPRRIKAVERHVKALRESMEWGGMFESFKARGFALGELNKLYLVGYFTVSSANSNANEVNQRRGEEARKARDEAYEKRRKESR
jgi:hypothetical protein